MENTFNTISIILAIWGILEIVLFFKVWKMTNDVEKLKNKFIDDNDNGEGETFVNMDIVSSVRALYYLNKKEEAYELLNKYLYYEMTYFANFTIHKDENGKEYVFIDRVSYYIEELINNAYLKTLPLYKALDKDIPDNLAPFDYEEYLKFGKE